MALKLMRVPVRARALGALVFGAALSLALPGIAAAQSIIACKATSGVDMLIWSGITLHQSGDQNPGIFRISGASVAEWDGVTHAYVDLCSRRYVPFETGVMVAPTVCAVDANTIRYSWSGSVRDEGTTITRTFNFFIDRSTGQASLDKIYDWRGDTENHAEQSYSGSCALTTDPATAAPKF